MEGTCLDCHTATVTGVRCRKCNGRYIAVQHAIDLKAQDRALISMVESEGLTAARLGDRLGVSRVAAELRIKGARKRQRLLAEVR